jgi:hypothetical protein
MKLSQHFKRALAIAAVAAFYYLIPHFNPDEAVNLRHYTLIAFFVGMIVVNVIRGIKEMQAEAK